MLLLVSLSAFAYDITTVGATWPDESFPVPWSLSSDLGDLDPVAAEAAVQAGFQVWEDAGCGVSFVYEGQVDDASFGGEFDGRNTVFFVSEGWPEDASLLTTPRIGTRGDEISEVDIALNAQHFAWAVEGADGSSVFDLTAGVAHEVGHLLGLWHSTVKGATLNPAMDGDPEAVSLSEDDLAGLCALYGESADPGAGAFGDACVELEDCEEGLVCLADGEDRYCSTTCEEDADCADGYLCADVGGEGVCAIGEASDGCGCAQGATGAGPAWILGAAGLLVSRRRRA